MQIIKQILVDAYYIRKLDKSLMIKDFLFVIYLFFGVCVWKAPMLVCVAFFTFVGTTNWSSDKRKTPEMISFLPMSQREMKKFVLKKSNLVAICSVIALWVSYGLAINDAISSIDNQDYELHSLTLEFVIYHGINLFVFIHLMVLMRETGRMRGMKDIGITHRMYSVKYSLVFAIYIIVFAALFFWLSIRILFDFENFFIPMLERILVIIGLIGQYKAYHYLKKIVLQEFIYSDYNAKITKEQEVDYEY